VGTISHDSTLIEPITSPERLYNTSPLKSLKTHEKNSSSPDIKFVPVDTSHVAIPVNTSPVVSSPEKIFMLSPLRDSKVQESISSDIFSHDNSS
jgi:hypothetical protein